MLDDILLAAIGGAKTVGALVEKELARIAEQGGLKPEEIEQVKRELRAKIEARTERARELAGPALSAVGEAVRGALDVPSRSELREMIERLERAAAKLDEKAGPPKRGP